MISRKYSYLLTMKIFTAGHRGMSVRLSFAKLGWVPEITLEEMCAEMVANGLEVARQYALLKKHGHAVSFLKK